MEATRTLVKSPPELWAEVSDVAALTRHLGEFGEIRITRTEPESVVEWEGDRTSGTVRLEPAGWGTRVTLTVEPLAGDTTVGEASADASLDASSPEATADPSSDVTADPSSPGATADPSSPEATADPSSPGASADPSSPDATAGAGSEPLRESRRGFFARLFGRLRRRRPPDEAPAVASADPVDSADAADPPQARVAVTPEPTPPQAPPVDPPEAPPVDPPEAPPVDPPEAPPADPPEAPPADPAMAAVDGAAVLGQALDALGKAHHRPYSR